MLVGLQPILSRHVDGLQVRDVDRDVGARVVGRLVVVQGLHRASAERVVLADLAIERHAPVSLSTGWQRRRLRVRDKDAPHLKRRHTVSAQAQVDALVPADPRDRDSTAEKLHRGIEPATACHAERAATVDARDLQQMVAADRAGAHLAGHDDEHLSHARQLGDQPRCNGGRCVGDARAGRRGCHVAEDERLRDAVRAAAVRIEPVASRRERRRRVG